MTRRGYRLRIVRRERPLLPSAEQVYPMHMVTRPSKPRPWRWTRAHLAQLPDDGHRYEVLGGALLVTPQARFVHQRVALRLARLIDAHCEAHGLGVVVGPGAVVWDDNELQPDVQVIPISDERARSAEWESLPLPLLVVEILSPGSERHDRGVKRAAYLHLGIQEYWVVDIEARTVSVLKPGAAEPVMATRSLTWQPHTDLPALCVDLTTLLGA